MAVNVRLILPGLFESHMIQAMTPDCREIHNQLISKLSKANHQHETVLDIYERLYQLTEAHLSYTPWLVDTTIAQNETFLRADPVILQPTHNGIVCRGNDILHLAPDEQQEISQLFNDYFKEQGLRLQFIAPDQAIVIITDAGESLNNTSFSPLAEVMGQDITHHLPDGELGQQWQRILMETQMLLHRAECNQRRSEQGEKTIGSLWFWGNTKIPPTIPKPDVDHIFTDDLVLQNALHTHSSEIQPVEEMLAAGERIDISTKQLITACIQNDPERWQSALQTICRDWLFPMIDATNRKTISSLSVVCESDVYQLKPWHRFRFWRE